MYTDGEITDIREFADIRFKMKKLKGLSVSPFVRYLFEYIDTSTRRNQCMAEPFGANWLKELVPDPGMCPKSYYQGSWDAYESIVVLLKDIDKDYL